METLVNEHLLRQKLSPYKRIAPLILDLFIWRHDYYPLLITAMVTSFFILVYYTAPSLITLISLMLLMVVLTDFTVGLLFTAGKSENDEQNCWSDENEKKFTILVNRICYYSVLLWNGSVSLEEWRAVHPNWYSISLITGLLATAWIGSSINNLLLVYSISLFSSLLPGLLHRGLIQVWGGRVVLLVLDLFKKGGEKKRE